MSTICFLKECDNFNGDFDCILHYTKIQNEAIQKIVMHYNAMRLKMEEVLIENAKYEENARKECAERLEKIYNKIREHSGSVSSPEASISALSPAKQNKKPSDKEKQFFKKIPGKENSPTKRPKSKNSRSFRDAGLSIDPKPAQEKRTKQTKLSFFTTSSAKKRKQQEDVDDDETYCEALENKINSRTDSPNNNNIDSDIFNFDSLESFRKHKIIQEKKDQVTPEKRIFSDVKIKQETDKEKSFKAMPLFSPELFLSDLSSSNSVVYVEPPESEVITISDRTYNPIGDVRKLNLKSVVKESRPKKLFEDSMDICTKREIFKEPIEEREKYDNECLDCMFFYEDIAEKKSVAEANSEINNCPIKCNGWKERNKRLKVKKPRKTGYVMIKCNNKFTRRRKHEDVNDTAPGIWDLNVEPRKSKPLFRRKEENIETPDL